MKRMLRRLRKMFVMKRGLRRLSRMVVLRQRLSRFQQKTCALLCVMAVGWFIMPFIVEAGEERNLSGLTLKNVFVSGEEGYHTFRIPSLLITPDGTILAFAEGRADSASDTGNIDTVLKRSFDGGNTWEPLQVICDDAENTCGNPTAVRDEETGRIWLFLTHNFGEDEQREIINGTSKGVRTIWSAYSDDDGATWSEPVNRFEEVQAPSTRWDATGPGAGIQLRHGPNKGRLIIPAIGRNIQSDDHGETWHESGRLFSGTSEATIVELTDGRLLRNDRSVSNKEAKRRAVSYSEDQGETWSPIVYPPELIDPIVAGSMTRLYPSDHPSGDQTILFANPASEQFRENMTVRMSMDDGETWPIAKTIYSYKSGYSSLAVFPDYETIGLLFEGGESAANERIMFAVFSREWLVSDEPVLDALEIEGGRLSPAFTEGIYEYAVYADEQAASVVLIPSSSADGAVIRVNGVEIASGESVEVPISEDETIPVSIEVSVGSFAKQYEIVVQTDRRNIPEPVLHWDFETSLDGRVVDARGEGQGPSGRLRNGAVLDDGGVHGRSLVLDGEGAHVEAEDGGVFDSGTDDFTLSMWIKPDERLGQSQLILFWHGEVGSGKPQWWIRAEKDGRIRVNMDGGGQVIAAATEPGQLSVDVWTHLAAVREGPLLNLYINGERVESAGPFEPEQFDYADAGIAPTLGYDKNPNNSRHWSGRIDEVKYYRQALIADEVRAVYEQGAAGLSGSSLDAANDSSAGDQSGEADAGEDESADNRAEQSEAETSAALVAASLISGFAILAAAAVWLLRKRRLSIK